MSLPSQSVSKAHETDEHNDAASLYSAFGAFGTSAQYRELLREEAAQSAGLRWPLLAELLGMDSAESDVA